MIKKSEKRILQVSISILAVVVLYYAIYDYSQSEWAVEIALGKTSKDDIIAQSIAAACIFSLPIIGLVFFVPVFLRAKEEAKRGRGLPDEQDYKEHYERIKDKQSLSRTEKRIAHPIWIGGVWLRPGDELRHLIGVGTTGTGKSQAIRRIATTAIERGEPMIVLDWGAELVRRIYRPDHDYLIAPYDTRSMPWSVLSDIEDETETREIAAAIIPSSAKGEAEEWAEYARTFLDAILTAAWSQMCEEGVAPGNQELLALINSGSPEAIEDWIGDDHPAKPMLTGSDDTMVRNIRNQVSSKAHMLRSLPPEAKGGQFSISEFVERAMSGDNVRLFIPVLPAYEQAGTVLGSLIASIAIKRIVSQTEDESRRLWLLVDELGQYPKIESLQRGVSVGRKYGLSIGCTVQAVSQLREKYGREGAITLLSNFGTKLIYRAGDNETADWASKEIGEAVKWYKTTSTATGAIGEADKETVSQHRTVEKRVLPSQIMEIDPLHAHIRRATSSIWTYTNIPYVNLGAERHPAINKRESKYNKQKQSLWANISSEQTVQD